MDPGGLFWNTVLHVGLTVESTLDTAAAVGATAVVGAGCFAGSLGMAAPVCAGITAEGATLSASSGYVTYHEWKYWTER
jgi:hypothetical protein